MKCLSLAGVLVSGSIENIHGVSGSEEMAWEIRTARDSGDSVGGTVVITVTGCPPGLGDPVFGKLDAALASAMMGIGAVKGVEIGSGFSSAGRYGSENNDPLVPGGLVTNNCGGVLGGISTGSQVFIRIAVKPTPSISRTQQTIDDEKRPREVRISGRHDPCIVPRIVPVAESMAALVVLDALLEQGMYTWYRSHVLPREV
jgi:chorismate synthase